MGIVVARRTVAKYRDVLKIHNAVERKKYYAWQHTDVQKDGKILSFG
jgi:predicted solute-binding protein